MMKTLIRLAALTCLTLILPACFAPKTPQEVTQSFWEAVTRDDTGDIVEYSTLTDPSHYDGFGKEWGGYHPSWGKVIIEGDRASIDCEFAGPANSGMKNRVFTTYLVRRNDLWLVDYDRTGEALRGGALGSLISSLSRLGDDLTKQFHSTADEFNARMEEMGRELEQLSSEFSQQAEESIERSAEELRKSIQELEDSINRALREKGDSLSDKDRRVLQEVSADLDRQREGLSEPTAESIASSSKGIGSAQSRLDELENDSLSTYREQWQELTEQFEKDMREMLEELSASSQR